MIATLVINTRRRHLYPPRFDAKTYPKGVTVLVKNGWREAAYVSTGVCWKPLS